jgi:hypothetical protein
MQQKLRSVALWLVGLAISTTTVACRPSPGHWERERDVPPASRDAFARFVIDCSTAANPRSDEEGEDLVAQCERTGIRVYGVYVAKWCPRDHLECVDRPNAGGHAR